MKIWGITDGSAGMVAQVKALADALNFSSEFLEMPDGLEMKVISLKKPWGFLPNICYDFLPAELIIKNPFSPPYPDLVISCGRKAALVSVAIKEISPQTKTIHIQDPQMASSNFDLVVAMEHDKIIGDNVIKTRFALHNITPEKLAEAKAKFTPIFEQYPKPHIAVLLGGTTNKYTLTNSRMVTVLRTLRDKLASTEGSLLITTSRRTGVENTAMLHKAFAGDNHVYIYDGIGDNPYLGLLACGDEIMISNDSVNMMSEAFATGKKVEILALPDHKNTKPSRFAEMLQTQPVMTGNEMGELADEVKKRLSLYLRPDVHL